MVLLLPDRYIWDFWFAPRRRGEPYHVFYLQAPRDLPDPEERHWIASVGHAVSPDLINWSERPAALGSGALGSWDDRAIWTGSITEFNGRYYWFYTALGQRDRVQRIGLATTTDLALEQWERHPANPLLEADPRWYEKAEARSDDLEAFRDPWVCLNSSTGKWLMFFTARANHGDPDGRGVVGLAESDDLIHWEQRPPVVAPGEFGELEVPQSFNLGGRWYLLFCTAKHSAARLARLGLQKGWNGTHYLGGDSLTGPYRLSTDEPLVGDEQGSYYAGRVVEGPDGRLCFMAWRHWDASGQFLGGLSNPVPVEQDAAGHLSVEKSDLWPKD